MTLSPSRVLDDLITERLGRSWDLRSQRDTEGLTYQVYSPDGRRVELGHAHGVHLWLLLPEGWRADTHADDLDSLVYEFDEFITLAEMILRRDVVPPQPSMTASGAVWRVPGSTVVMRLATAGRADHE